MTTTLDFKAPIFFQHNRVWRCYTGGALLDKMLGIVPPKDNYFPEDWLASVTLANNGEHQQHPNEGLSRVRLPDGSDGPLFKDVTDGIGVLCKFLDSSVRLPIQCHPDREFARKYYHSEHGKAESWMILDTRLIKGEQPYLLMGFKPGIKKEIFAQAVMHQDINTMKNLLHKIPVYPGEAYFIPGRFPHAIGPGVLMLEIQEPTDWVVQPEEYCAATKLSPADMWGPLTPDIGLECFDYQGEKAEDMLHRLRMRPKIIGKTNASKLENIIGPQVTDCFIVDRLQMEASAQFTYENSRYLGIVTNGSGSVKTSQNEHAIARGDCFFISQQIKQLRFQAQEKLTVYIVKKG